MENTQLLFVDDHNGAEFSDCRRYRYRLWRIWDKNKPLMMFIGLNPSTANETEPDPTIRRVRSIAQNQGYGGFYMTNLFAYVSTDPDLLLLPVARDDFNDYILKDTAAKCEKIVFAWGNFKQAQQRASEVIEMFQDRGFALHINNNGSPKHPLYCRADTIPVPYPL